MNRHRLWEKKWAAGVEEHKKVYFFFVHITFFSLLIIRYSKLSLMRFATLRRLPKIRHVDAVTRVANLAMSRVSALNLEVGSRIRMGV